MTRSQQRDAEIERGRQMVERTRRVSLIERYIQAKKLAVEDDYGVGLNVDHRKYIVGGVVVFRECLEAKHYPSDALMATLALAIAATTGLDDVAPLPPTHHVSAAGKAYNADLAKRNANRPDML